MVPSRIAPLCEFGGNQFKPHTDEVANGTYAVCPKCLRVCHCGYIPDGVHPKECEGCGNQFRNADYFQPVYGRRAKNPCEDFFRPLTAE